MNSWPGSVRAAEALESGAIAAVAWEAKCDALERRVASLIEAGEKLAETSYNLAETALVALKAIMDDDTTYEAVNELTGVLSNFAHTFDAALPSKERKHRK